MIKLKIKDDSNNNLDKFRDIFGKTNQLGYFEKGYGLDNINLDFVELYDKCFENNLTLAKNCVLKKSLTYFPLTTRVFIKSNHSEHIRNGVCAKGLVISIGNSIDPSNFKEIGTQAYWINNSITIWNSLTVMLGYKPTNLNLVRVYKNSILVKFHRKFEIEILNSDIRIKTFFQLQFMKKWVSLENSSLDKIDNILIELPTVKRLLENVLKMFLQFDSEYWIMPVECMPIYGIMEELDIYIDAKKNRQPLTHIEKDWMFDQRHAWDRDVYLSIVKFLDSSVLRKV
jgi:hypothetical protein